MEPAAVTSRLASSAAMRDASLAASSNRQSCAMTVTSASAALRGRILPVEPARRVRGVRNGEARIRRMDRKPDPDQGTVLRPVSASLLLSEIDRPGVYVTERGDLLRIASEFMVGGRTSLSMAEGCRRVTRLSEDPCESVSECRRVAAKSALPFNF